jgi:hypothetical protein
VPQYFLLQVQNHQETRIPASVFSGILCIHSYGGKINKYVTHTHSLTNSGGGGKKKGNCCHEVPATEVEGLEQATKNIERTPFWQLQCSPKHGKIFNILSQYTKVINNG